MKIISKAINVCKVLVEKYQWNEEASQKTMCVWDDNVTTGLEPESGKCNQLPQQVTEVSSLNNGPSVSINSEWIVITWAHIRTRLRRNIISTDHQR
jgi:hypothetical protein